MIKLLTKQHGKAVRLLCDKLHCDGIQYDLLVTTCEQSARKYLADAIKNDNVIMVGNVGEYATLFADTFNLTMFYDSYAEKTVAEYCKLAKVAMPAQHVLDKICTIPETFNHYSAVYGYQCGCFGEYNKKQIYILPNDPRECDVLYTNYLSKILLMHQEGMTKYVFKVFGFAEGEISKRLDTLGKNVQYTFETDNLDSRITLFVPAKTTKSALAKLLEQFNNLFGANIYANADQSLAKTVVQLLAEINCSISTAESITGGMIASSIVDVAGSSAVFYEGAVTYSSVAKSKRLSISPHYIDEFGAVSPQVAKAMAEGLMTNGSDIVVTTTGYAGPDSTGKTPVGLCYIAVGTHAGVTVHKSVFAGDRNTIRAQATNTALFLVVKSIKK